jgi:DNA polymerase elongation subunit (family B)
MDLELFGYLTPDQQQRYKELEALFSHPGWSLFVEFAEQEAEAQLERLVGAPNWDINRLATGARAAYMHMAKLKDITDLQFTNIAVTNREEQESTDELNE